MSWSDETQIARTVADAVSVCIVKGLLARIRAVSETLEREAIQECFGELGACGWQVDRARALHSISDLRGLIDSMGIDRAIADEVFQPSRADVVIEHLRGFIRAHRIKG